MVLFELCPNNNKNNNNNKKYAEDFKTCYSQVKISTVALRTDNDKL